MLLLRIPRPPRSAATDTLFPYATSFRSAAAAPLSGYKFSAAEGGLRVPLIIAWPGNAKVRASVVSNGFAHVTDIVPTLADLAGVPLPGARWNGKAVEPVTGRSLVPMLEGAADGVHGDAPLGYELAGNAALVRGDFRSEEGRVGEEVG